MLMKSIRFISEYGTKIYRKTLKKSRYLHRIFYKIMQFFVIPLLEKTTNFFTIQNDPLWIRIAYLTGSYEKGTVQLVKKIVKPGMVVLDIGAHVGFYSKLFSKLVGNRGLVIAFEPHPATFSVLCKNVSTLTNIIPVQAAVAGRKGRASFYDCLIESGSASLCYDEYKKEWLKNRLSGREIAPRVLNGLPGSTYTISTTTVDSYLEERHIERVDFIKIDIEGAEINAIRGMKNILRSSSCLTVIMEFNPQALQLFGITPKKALEELQKGGLSIVLVIEDNGRLTRVENNNMAIELAIGLKEKLAKVNLLCEKEASRNV